MLPELDFKGIVTRDEEKVNYHTNVTISRYPRHTHTHTRFPDTHTYPHALSFMHKPFPEIKLFTVVLQFNIASPVASRLESIGNMQTMA